jgi:hypothetical protein
LREIRCAREGNAGKIFGHWAKNVVNSSYTPPLGDDQESFDSGEDRLIERIINLVVLLTEAQKREIA